jgi:hypothetical protein
MPVLILIGLGILFLFILGCVCITEVSRTHAWEDEQRLMKQLRMLKEDLDH